MVLWCFPPQGVVLGASDLSLAHHTRDTGILISLESELYVQVSSSILENSDVHCIPLGVRGNLLTEDNSQ